MLVAATLSAASSSQAQDQPIVRMEYARIDGPAAGTIVPTSLVIRTAPAAQPAAVQPQAVEQPAVAQQVVQAGDPYGFIHWLNATRAQYGLAAVGYDPNLEGWAAVNNSHQNARGLGHFVMGPARRQNSAMGNYASIGSMWMSSPAHRSALLDPTISFIGIAGAGAYWTFNAY